ncbi:threonine dehydratase [Mycobacteroides abscessus subsp. abscessus]|nr:threonine dehydratase [Mycobacteroides abscessus subsp. abscessus]
MMPGMAMETSGATGLVTVQEIQEVAERLAPVIRRTPMVAFRALSDRCGHEVRLKCENLQRTGSFKPRGAYNRISQLPGEQRVNGVVAASAGNHAQGVAWAATTLGIPSTVFMPVGAALPKIVATRAYGATVHLTGSTIDDALLAATEFAAETGAVLIHPFDHRDVVAGQATVGLEILEQLPEVGTIVVPAGGGGLVAGVAAVVKAARPEVRNTMADGIAVGKPGAVPFEHVAALVDDVVTVSEEALSRGLLLCLERAKLVVEPAGAAAVAALLTLSAEELGLTGPVCAVLSGGNIDPLLLTHVITHGLRAAGRYLTVRVTVADAPGGLSGLLDVFRASGASVVDVTHWRNSERLRLGEVDVLATVETRGPEHRQAVLDAIVAAGLTVQEER